MFRAKAEAGTTKLMKSNAESITLCLHMEFNSVSLKGALCEESNWFAIVIHNAEAQYDPAYYRLTTVNFSVTVFPSASSRQKYVPGCR